MACSRAASPAGHNKRPAPGIGKPLTKHESWTQGSPAQKRFNKRKRVKQYRSARPCYLMPLLKKSMPYDSEKEFVPLAKVGDLYLIYATNTTVPAKDMRQFVALAR